MNLQWSRAKFSAERPDYGSLYLPGKDLQWSRAKFSAERRSENGWSVADGPAFNGAARSLARKVPDRRGQREKKAILQWSRARFSAESDCSCDRTRRSVVPS